MKRRRTVADLVLNYRRARRKRDPDEIQATSLELGAALAKTGCLSEIADDNTYAIVWQPVATEGGPPGFSESKRFRNIWSVPAPQYRPAFTPQLQPA